MNRKKISSIIAIILLLSNNMPNVYATQAIVSVSPVLKASNITVNNNLDPSTDNLVITALATDEIVNVYSVATGGSVIASGSYIAADTSVTINTPQLNAIGGTIYVSLTTTGLAESKRTAVKYSSEISTTLSATAITVNNLYGTSSDTVSVSGLTSGDAINLYSTAIGGTSIVGTVADSETSVSINPNNCLNPTGGTIYVSVTKANKAESKRVAKKYNSEPVATALISSAITVTNNSGTSGDTISVVGLTPDDTIFAYTSATKGSPIASANVTDVIGTIGSSQLAPNITNLLNSTGGTIYISLEDSSSLESKRTAVKYASEISTTLAAAAITVNNVYDKSSDTVSVSGLLTGDTINLYSTATGSSLITSQTTSIITGLELNSTGGTLYVSVTKYNKSESKRVAKKYNSEATATALTSSVIVNDSGTTDDTISVVGLTPGDTIFAYTSATKGSPIASATVAVDSNTATIAYSQLTTPTINLLNATGGTIYLSLKNPSTLESKRTAVKYASEISTTLSAAAITVNNLYDTINDTVLVSGLTSGDVINLYSAATGSSVIASGTVLSGAIALTINTLSNLSSNGGTIYVSITNANKTESKRVAKKYNSEDVAIALISSTITVTNNSGTTSDTISVPDLLSGDTIFAYTAATNGVSIASDTVATSSTIGTISCNQLTTPTTNLLNSAGGTIYISVKNSSSLESKRTAVKYASEISTTLSTAAITVNNLYDTTNDTVSVSGLTSGDIINLYSTASGSSVIASGTVTTSSSVSISTTELSDLGGTIYVSITSTNKLESTRTAIKYTSVETSTALLPSAITVTNILGNNDTISIPNSALTTADTVNVYSTATGGISIGSGNVSSGSLVSISTTELSDLGGTIYVSVKSTNKLESTRTAIKYVSVATSTALLPSSITVTNNIGSSDTILVSGLTSTDTINVYSTANGGNPIASGTGSVDISTTGLNDLGGTVYVSVTSENKLESTRIAKTYSSDISTILLPSSITVTNNYGPNDNIAVTGLASGDSINVYSASTGVTAFVTATAASNNIDITTQLLSSTGGTIYVTITNANKVESAPIPITYGDESSAALTYNEVTVTNNYGSSSDVITVTGLSSGDIINLYSSDTATVVSVASNPLSSGSTSVTIQNGDLSTDGISLLNSTGGSIYLSVTNINKGESIRTMIPYISEPVTSPLTTAAIGVTDAPSGATGDNVSISGLSSGDIINVYSGSTGGSSFLLGTATASGTSLTLSSSTVDLAKSAFGAGTIYVSITKSNELESTRTKKTYITHS